MKTKILEWLLDKAELSLDDAKFHYYKWSWSNKPSEERWEVNKLSKRTKRVNKLRRKLGRPEIENDWAKNE